MIDFGKTGASAAEWASVSGNNNDIQKITIDSRNIRIIGTHSKSGSRQHYRTVGYYLTLEKYNLNDYFSKGTNASIEKARIPVEVYDDFSYSSSMIQTVYTIKREDFLKAAAALSLKPEDIGTGRVKVYLHNIFITREYLDDGHEKSAVTSGTDEIFGKKEILEAPARYRLGFREWGSRTQEIIPYYYNLEFTLTAAGLYEVSAVCEDTSGVLLDTKKNAGLSAAGQTFEYGGVSQEITSDGVSFRYARRWYLEYENRNSGERTKLPEKAGSVRYEGMPDAASATLHLIYDREEGTVPEEGEITDEIRTSIVDPGASGMIEADKRGAEQFKASIMIPGGERVYALVKAPELLLGYRFVKHSGTKRYDVLASRDYVLSWEGAAEGERLEETVTVTRVVTISREYSYWEAAEFELYALEEAVITNAAFKAGRTVLESAGAPVDAKAVRNGNESYYISAPKLSVTLPAREIWSDTKDRPDPGGISWDEADAAAGEITVRNDKVIFNGKTVLSDTPCSKKTSDPQLGAVRSAVSESGTELFKEGLELGTETENGSYGSGGTAKYRLITSASGKSTKTLSYPVYDINSVRIHTPAVCSAKVTGAADRFVQAEQWKPETVQLLLDPDSGFAKFSVQIRNTGMHTVQKGYGNRDYQGYIGMTGSVLNNEVKFPFDVFKLDDKNQIEDYVPKDTWIRIGKDEVPFVVPVWVDEGDYYIEFRSIAANGTGKEDKCEPNANKNPAACAASDTAAVQVSGRISDFTVYDISDYPVWKKVFRVPDSLKLKKDAGTFQDGTGIGGNNLNYADYFYSYMAGTSDRYGRPTGRKQKYTLPVFYGSHPAVSEAGILKCGYQVRFSLVTTGEGYRDDTGVRLTPEFYFAGKGGTERIPAELYYEGRTADGNRGIIKVGSAYDQVNLKSAAVKDAYLAIPAAELKLTAGVRSQKLSELINRTAPLYSFGRIEIPYEFRTLINSGWYEKLTGRVKNKIEQNDYGKADAIRGVQRWYGEYHLPANIRAVGKGTDVAAYAKRYGIDGTEEFWLEDGYLIVHMVISRNEKSAPQKRLLYDNTGSGGGNMWEIENASLTAKEKAGNKLPIRYGDVLIFRLDKSAADDYPVYGVY